MPINGYFDVVFAVDGTVSPVPDAVQGNGTISYTQGWTAPYSLAPSNPSAILVSRAQTNQIFNDLTSAIQFMQQNGASNFITTLMNGGTPYAYNLGAVVAFNAGSGLQNWVSLSNDNTTIPGNSGALWAPFIIRTALTGNTSYYVSTLGSDSTGNGTSASPWATIQYAVNFLLKSIDLAGFTATINVADGTYTPFVVVSPFTGGGSVQITGDNTTPANCIIAATASGAASVTAAMGATFYIKGFELTSSTGPLLNAYQGGKIYANGNMNYGAAGSGSAHMNCLDTGSYINFSSNYTISGSAAFHFAADFAAEINGASVTITLSGTPTFTDFATANQTGVISASSLTFSGSATGTRYSATLNGVINTNGGGGNYFPGNSNGSTATGGQYA